MAFTWRLPITQDHTKAGSNNSTNFPVTIQYTNIIIVGTARPDGFDIRPFSDIGLTTPLDYWLESYDNSIGAIIMSVRLPTVNVSSDVLFYLGWGDPSLNTNGSSTTTWNSNYKLVSLDGGLTNIVGSSPFTLTNPGGAVVPASPGYIGNLCAAYDNSPALIGLAASGTHFSDLSVEGWIFMNNIFTGGIPNEIVTKGYDGTNTEWYFEITDGSGHIHIGTFNGSVIGDTSTDTVPLTTWTFVAGRFKSSGTLWSTRVNGGTTHTTSGIGPISTNQDFAIGAVYANGTPVEPFGQSTTPSFMDVLRISDVAHDDSWWTAQYNNQKPSQDLLIYGVPSLITSGSISRLSMLGVG